jgi:hypothetical protein
VTVSRNKVLSVVLAIVAIAISIVARRAASSISVQEVRIVDASTGLPLETFFTQLPSDAKIAKRLAHYRFEAAGCQKKSASVVSGLASLMGLTFIVHAQTDCPMGGDADCTFMNRIGSQMCGGYCSIPGGTQYYPIADPDVCGTCGTYNDGSLSCGTTGCGCNQTFCVVT